MVNVCYNVLKYPRPWTDTPVKFSLVKSGVSYITKSADCTLKGNIEFFSLRNKD